MSSLSMLERQVFEDLFGMDSGYVLNFSDGTFHEFIQESVSKDIDSDAYLSRGTSKAKRLRAFFDAEPDPVVGQLLLDLLKWRGNDGVSPEALAKAYGIINRLGVDAEFDSSKLNKVSDEDKRRIWGADYGKAHRVFISHTHHHKRKAVELQSLLKEHGIRVFVAHEDIKPSKEWLIEIENALFSMSALVAIISKHFIASEWTDQEIGHALGQKILTIPIKLDRDPYGFMGKYQAIAHSSWEQTAHEIHQILTKNGTG